MKTKKKTKMKHSSIRPTGIRDSELFQGLFDRGLHSLAGRDLMIQYLELHNLGEDVLAFIDEHKDA